MKANRLAQDLILQLPSAASTTLSDELLKVARAPLIFQDGLLYFASEERSVWPGPYSDPTLTATVLEADSSHIHVDSFDTCDSELEALQKALLYARELAENIRQLTSWPVTMILSTQGEEFIGAVVRFHLTRDGEQWLSDDLEGFIQPVIVLQV